MYYSPVRHSFGQASLAALVRLACIRHAASVYPEPGSNSSFDFSSPEFPSGFLINSLTLCVSSVQFSKISRPLSRARFVILPQFVSLSTVFSRTFFGSFFFCLFLCGVLYITCLSPLCKVFFSLFLLLFSVYAFRFRMAKRKTLIQRVLFICVCCYRICICFKIMICPLNYR